MKEIVITGGNSGIGFETVKELARKGNRVIFTVRDGDKGKMAMDLIRKECGLCDVSYVVLDLSDFDSIQQGVKEILDRCPRIDVLIHNAGTYQSSRHENEGGIEITFMVNHIAPFYMTHLLLPLLIKSSEGRIISVNSDSHYQGAFDPNNLNLERKYHGLRAYCRSKLANVLFTHEFHRRNPFDHISIYAVHPGLVNTDIGAKHASFFEKKIWNWRSQYGTSPGEGAVTSIHLAAADGTELTSGGYYENRKLKKASKASYNEEYARTLWKMSMEMCGMEKYF